MDDTRWLVFAAFVVAVLALGVSRCGESAEAESYTFGKKISLNVTRFQ